MRHQTIDYGTYGSPYSISDNQKWRARFILACGLLSSLIAAWWCLRLVQSQWQLMRTGAATIDQVSLTLAACCGAAISLWVLLGIALELWRARGLIDTNPSPPQIPVASSGLWSPVNWRRLALAAAGVCLSSNVASAAQASGQGPLSIGRPTTCVVAAATMGASPGIDPHWGAAPPPSPPASQPEASGSVSAPSSEPPTQTEPASRSTPAQNTQPPAPGTLTVQPGDTLWQIAREHLPAGATNEQTAQAWPRWYAANRQVIGTHPEVIQPGWVLQTPESTNDAPAAPSQS